MDWFTRILQLFQLAPAILQTIHQVEVIIGPGNGDVKKAIVMAPVPPQLASEVSTLIDNIVTAMNTAKADTTTQSGAAATITTSTTVKATKAR